MTNPAKLITPGARMVNLLDKTPQGKRGSGNRPKVNVKALARRVDKVRNFPINTCPASRHLHTMADCLMTTGGYPMLTEEPEHCAESIYAVLASLWEARTELAKRK